jgi:hypothetical protein
MTCPGFGSRRRISPGRRPDAGELRGDPGDAIAVDAGQKYPVLVGEPGRDRHDTPARNHHLRKSAMTWMERPPYPTSCRRQRHTGQFRSRASTASRMRDQVSSVSGALWLNPPPNSRLT